MKVRTFLLILFIYLLLFAGMITLRGELLALAIPLILYFAVGFWKSPGEIRLTISRTISMEHASPGTPVLINLQVKNEGLDIDNLLLEDHLPSGLKITGGSNHHLVRLKSGDIYPWQYTVEGNRGYYVFSHILAEGEDSFGLFPRKTKIPAPGTLLVQPPVVRIKRVAIQPRRTNVYSGIIPAHLGGPGVEFFGVREYQSGDPLRWINWNTSARHPQKLYTNEYEQERVADVGIILDGRLVTNPWQGDNTIFEYSIQASAALAVSFLNQGNRVGLLLYGRYLQWTFPGYGKTQKERILQSLAHAEKGDSLVFTNLGHLPTQFFPPHSQIILVSPLVDSDYPVLIQLRACGYQVLIISPDPVSFEISLLESNHENDLAGRMLRLERKHLINKIRRAGIQVWDWNVSIPFDQAGVRASGRPIAWFRAIGR